jgi:hypothetical protein
MTRSHPLTKATQAELRARLAKHLPAVEPLIEELGQIVVASWAGTFEAYARTRNPPGESIAAKAEARFDTFVAEGRRFWQATITSCSRGPTPNWHAISSLNASIL